MAGMKFIDDAQSVLEERIFDLKTIIETVDSAVGEDGESPPWLHLMRRHVLGIDEASQVYMTQVHQHARPVLDDLARLSRN